MQIMPSYQERLAKRQHKNTNHPGVIYKENKTANLFSQEIRESIFKN